MKRLALLLALLPMLAAYAAAENTVFLPGEIVPEDFVFTFDGEAYPLGCEAAELIAAIEAASGAPMDIIEAPSCLFSGMDREYSNEELVVATYPIGLNGADTLETVMVFSPEYPSARGVCVGMDRSAVEAAYGEASVLDYNQMYYYLSDAENSPMLVFTLEDDIVAEYYLFLNTGA